MKFVEEDADELDLQMIVEFEAENDGGAISFEDMAKELDCLYTDEK